MASDQQIVVVGGGIIGAATAFYLAEAGAACTVVEREGVAAAASGKAGGFLALDWNDSSPVGPLARHSYALHRALAQRFGAEEIGYRELDTVQIVGQAAPPQQRQQQQQRAVASRAAQLPSWLDGHISVCSRLGSKATTAQVHPEKLTRALLAAAQERGAQLLLGAVTGVGLDEGGAVSCVRMLPKGEPQERELPARAVVLAMGPWTGAARAWLPSAPHVTGQKYHSVVLRHAPGAVGATAVFTSFRTAGGRTVEPELYPRPDGTVYACGEPQSEEPVPPEGPAGVSVDAGRVATIRGAVASLSSALAEAAVEAEQACYLPVAEGDGLPVIGALPGVPGAFVATGHSCWGILNGPATGQAVAELLLQGAAKSVDLTAFDPARLLSSTARR